LSRKIFQLSYPDGSKKHIARPERDDLLLRGLIKPSEARSQYNYIGQVKTFHSFADWAKTYADEIEILRRFLPGSFVIERDGRRKSELLETPEAYACRLKLYESSASEA
jgi:hypothetical protein